MSLLSALLIMAGVFFAVYDKFTNPGDDTATLEQQKENSNKLKEVEGKLAKERADREQLQTKLDEMFNRQRELEARAQVPVLPSIPHSFRFKQDGPIEVTVINQRQPTMYAKVDASTKKESSRGAEKLTQGKKKVRNEKAKAD